MIDHRRNVPIIRNGWVVLDLDTGRPTAFANGLELGAEKAEKWARHEHDEGRLDRYVVVDFRAMMLPGWVEGNNKGPPVAAEEPSKPSGE